MTQIYKIGKCLVCDKEKEIVAKGKCKTCYNIENASNQPTDFLCPFCKLKTQQYGSSNKCYKCYMKEYNKINYEQKKEVLKQKSKENYELKKDIRQQQIKEYDLKNKEARKEYQKKYYAERKQNE